MWSRPPRWPTRKNRNAQQREHKHGYEENHVRYQDITLYWTDGGPRKYRFDAERSASVTACAYWQVVRAELCSMCLSSPTRIWTRPLTEPEKMAVTVREMFGGKRLVRTLEVAASLGRNYGTVKTHLHRAGQLGLLICVPRKGWLPAKIAGSDASRSQLDLFLKLDQVQLQ
ncbi:hypothetical protein CA13_01910 [Planctomycetes bacterium CA13]|uniref:Uncharacterized protein n=1 Tax=Novipirellula herctigrandis TaxID=2527986 RepID=A0A5C5YUV5_9BACT|nr:hypothetical protein CA13_01910 [Planctomycetes bacterium CA13]